MEAGASQRVTINDEIDLDFTGLFSTEDAPEAPRSPTEPILEAGTIKTTLNGENRQKTQIEGLEGQQAKQLYLQDKREKEDHERSLEVYRTYQENIKASSQLQTEILKGLAAGEDIYSLFLKAAKAISLMTSNTVFYSQTEDSVKKIYGAGLQEKPVLQMELQETEERLQRLREAESRDEPPDSLKRIQAAIKAHEARIETFSRMIEKTQL